MNVISLFNNQIPLIAIQMRAFKIDKFVSLSFVRVLDIFTPGDDDELEEYVEVDRAYWEKKTPESLKILEELFKDIQKSISNLSIKYNQQYLGTLENGKSNNFCMLFPQRRGNCRIGVVLKPSDVEAYRDKVEFSKYYERESRAYINLTSAELASKKELILEIIKLSHRNFSS